MAHRMCEKLALGKRQVLVLEATKAERTSRESIFFQKRLRILHKNDSPCWMECAPDHKIVVQCAVPGGGTIPPRAVYRSLRWFSTLCMHERPYPRRWCR